MGSAELVFCNADGLQVPGSGSDPNLLQVIATLRSQQV